MERGRLEPCERPMDEIRREAERGGRMKVVVLVVAAVEVGRVLSDDDASSESVSPQLDDRKGSYGSSGGGGSEFLRCR